MYIIYPPKKTPWADIDLKELKISKGIARWTWIYTPTSKYGELRENIERILCAIFLVLWLGFIYGGIIIGLIIRIIKRF